MSDLLTVLQGDCRETLKALPEASVQMCVTSPPYWGLRSYLPAGHELKALEIGSERTPEEYVANIVEVFRQVHRVLKPDGTCWVNLGDCYATGAGKVGDCPGGGEQGEKWKGYKGNRNGHEGKHKYKGVSAVGPVTQPNRMPLPGLKPKDLVGIPWRVAFALQAAGWYLRCDIIWHKPNPMPESVTDRPTKAHEYLFLLSKSERYFYDAEAIKEPPSPDLIKQIEEGYNGKATKDFAGGLAQDASATKSRIIEGYRQRIDKQRGHSRRHNGFNDRWDKLSVKEQALCGRNKRSVWTIPPANYAEAHFATFPPDLVRPCILAGSRPGDVVIDPFGGSGTVGEVALELGRRAILCELNPEYHPLIEQRCNTTPGLALA